jgi:hypothetical protein
MTPKLIFEMRSVAGRNRYYPLSIGAKTIVGITGRKCLNQSEIERLTFVGFFIEVSREEGAHDSAT